MTTLATRIEAAGPEDQRAFLAGSVTIPALMDLVSVLQPDAQLRIHASIPAEIVKEIRSSGQ